MIQQVSDTDIRADVRSHMARHRIDIQRAQFRVANGMVRMSGALYHLGGHVQSVALSVVESLERDVLSTPGVRHGFFEFENWRRVDGGNWEPVKGMTTAVPAGEGRAPRLMAPIPLEELLDVMPRLRAA